MNELVELSDNIDQARNEGVGPQGIRQSEVDSMWAKWCAIAAAELAEATGVDSGEIGQPYAYERKDLIAEAKRGRKGYAEDGKEYDANAAASWMHMRLCEALAVAEGKAPYSD